MMSDVASRGSVGHRAKDGPMVPLQLLHSNWMKLRLGMLLAILKASMTQENTDRQAGPTETAPFKKYGGP